MKGVGSIAVVGAFLVLAAAPHRAAAQDNEEAWEPLTMRNGPQFVVDHWPYDAIMNLGTNPGAGWRLDIAFSHVLSAEMTSNLFRHSFHGASLGKTLYIEF